MNKPRNAQPTGLASSALPNQLPASLMVPPLPPRVHRRLLLSSTDNGLLLRPLGVTTLSEDPAVLVRWGQRGKVEPCDKVPEEDDDETVEIGGILGIVRLWDAAYLVVFLPSTKAPTQIFPNDDPFGELTTHEVHTLGDVYHVPLVASRAASQLSYLRSLMARRAPKQPKPRRTPSKSKLNWRLPWASSKTTPQSTSAASTDDESDADSDTDPEAEFETRARRVSSIAPEADETPPAMPPTPEDETPEARVKRRFSLGWGRFKPRLGKPRAAVKQEAPTEAQPATEAEAAEAPEDSPTVEEVLPSVTVDIPSPISEEPPALSALAVPAPASPAMSAVTKPQEPASPSLLPGKVPARPASPVRSLPVDAPQRRELETKIMKQLTRELASGEFYYSFNFDCSHTLQHKRRRLASRNAAVPLLEQLLGDSAASKFFPPSPVDEKKEGGSRTSSPSGTATPNSRLESDIIEPDIHIPLWRRFDRRFFWNEWLVRDFIDLGLHAYVLPVSQGWVQASTFSIPIPPSPTDEAPEPIPIDIALISRRSKDRAGLRYQRRGIDHEGHVANFVETEMIIRAKVGGKVSLFSFVQIRGSIPLKWSQTPWSMKPPPVLDLPVDQTFSVANLHFDDLRHRYGPVTIINLSEQSGKEGTVTNAYTDLIKDLDRQDLTYVSFDFHAKCHGMNWDNISELVADLDFENMGYMWSLQGEVVREQKGVFRTNCIDCLDRTNVVQSALARNVLSQMLQQLGIVVDPSTCNIEAVFNDIWANNGDMISLCYAHTSALKGDFVRTGKRDISGMLNDGVSSLSRMFYGAVTDFWAQAVISFMLGHRNLGVFNEFIENLQTTERSALIKQSGIRAAAIETSSARVFEEGERRLAGWTLLSPDDRNTRLSTTLEEKVLLLTKEALYVVSFNYSLEKVNEFTRIPLKSITSIQKGAYILSALQEAGRDPIDNAGFMIHFSPSDESTRYSTYSIRTKTPPISSSLLPTPSKSRKKSEPPTPNAKIEHALVDPNASEYFAFKALPREFSARGRRPSNDADDDDDDDVGLEVNETCAATVERIVNRIRDQCARVHPVGEEFVVDKDVVSVADAESATSLASRIDYAWKRFLWL